jgi:hypothetical protein
MVVFTAATAVIGVLGVVGTIQVVSTVASIAYQQSQARKAKKAAAAAADRAKGIDTKVSLSSENLPVVYGLNKVGGNVVWAALSDNYNHTGLNISGTGLRSWTNIVSSSQLYDTIWGPNPLLEGSIISFNNQILRRNSVVATGAPPRLSFSSNSVASLYYEQLSDSSEPLFRPGAFTEFLSELGLLSTTGLRKSVGPNFFLSTTTNVNHTHATLDRSLTGNRKEFLFAQQAICAAGINRVVAAEVDNKPANSEEFQFGQRIDVCNGTASAANPMIAANFPGERSNAFFTNITHASMCFRLNRDEPQYSAIPRVQFIIEGQRVRDILNDNGVYFFSTSRIYTDNPALILADYLTSSVYGRGLLDRQLNLESFWKAKEVAGTVISNEVSYTNYAAVSRGASSLDATLTAPTTLYSCNVVLDTDRDVWDNVQTILNTMNDPSLIWSEGQYKLQLDFPRSSQEQEALLVVELQEKDVIRDSISITYPSQDDKLNQCTVRFRNSNKLFSDDSVTWPPRNSSVLTAYLQQDNGVELKSDLYLDGLVDPYHASHIAEQTVRESRFAAVVSFVVTKKHINLEPGDLIKLSLSEIGISQVLRVVETEVREGLGIVIKAKYFDWENLAWNVDSNQPGSTLPQPSSYVKPVFNLGFFPNSVDAFSTFSAGRLSWGYANTDGYEFVVEIQRAGDETWIELGVSLSNNFDLPILSEGVYLIAVTARAALSRKTSVKVIFETSIEPLVPPINAVITQQPYNLRFIWTPISDARISGYSIYKRLPIAPENLLGRTDTNFFDWPVRTNCGLCIAEENKSIYVVANNIDGTSTAPSIINFFVRAPSIKDYQSEFDQNEIVLTWKDDTNQFAVDRYRVRADELNVDQFVYASSYRQIARWSGAVEWQVTPIDVAGNVGEPLFLTIVLQPPAAVVNLSSRTVINNTILNWKEPAAGSLPVSTYEVRRGDNPDTGFSIGFYSGTFATLFEDVAGEYQYWVAAIDTAGNYGPWSSTTTLVIEPRGFVLVDEASFTLPSPTITPINRTETWQQHFENNSWTTIQDQLDAGFPIFIQPAKDFEEFTYFLDLGTVITAIQLQTTIDKIAVSSANAEAEVFFSIREEETDPWIELLQGRTVFADRVRYIRIRYVFNSSDNRRLSNVGELSFKALVIQKDDSGTSSVLASDTDGTEIFFKTEFIDVSSITVTVKNATVPLIPIYIFDDQPNPTSFKVKVFDLNGNRQNATVGWSANGV